MDCDHCRDRIEDYIGDKLLKDERLSFEQHLYACENCAELVRLQRLSEKVINHEKSLSPGHFFTEKVMAVIQNFKPETEPVLTRILRPALVTISVAAAIFAGVLIGSVSRPSERKVPVELLLINDTEIESP